MSRQFVLFLPGEYSVPERKLYKQYLNGRTTVAVDGGYRFFKLSKKQPDILVGDFDSIGKLPNNADNKIEIITFPIEKNKTDLHLAIDICLDRDAKDIIIIMPEIGEPDHYLGNLMLLISGRIKKWLKNGGKIKIIQQKIHYHILIYSSLTINNAKNATLSVIPISQTATLTATCTAYNVRNLKLHRGDSRALRNRITANRATVKLDGTGWVIISN